MRAIALSATPSLTPSLTSSLTHSLNPSLTPSLARAAAPSSGRAVVRAVRALLPAFVPAFVPALALALSAGACADVDEARLDHAQILAVRTEPAHVAPGGTARVDVLAGDDSGAVFVTSPDELVATGAAGPLHVERTAEGWFVTAGAAPELATLEVTVSIDGVAWPARKALVVGPDGQDGQPAENPRVAAMQIDGAASDQLVAPAGTQPELTAIGVGREPLSYAWYSSVGTLERYRQPSAALDAAEAGEGAVLLVVRDGAGGVGWHILPARVE